MKKLIILLTVLLPSFAYADLQLLNTKINVYLAKNDKQYRSDLSIDLKPDGKIELSYKYGYSTKMRVKVSSGQFFEKMNKANNWLEVAKKNNVKKVRKELQPQIITELKMVSSNTFTAMCKPIMHFVCAGDDRAVFLAIPPVASKENEYIEFELHILQFEESHIKDLSKILERSNLEKLWKEHKEKKDKSEDLFK
jgi:hypothetical protein